MTPDFVRRAHAAGYAVHVWFSGQEESERVYHEMLDMGADGLMPAKPARARAGAVRAQARRGPPTPRPTAAAGRAVAAEHASPACGRRRGRVTLRLRRRGPLNVACGGRVRLRTKAGAKLGGARFRFPYGVRATTVTVPLKRTARGTTAIARVTGAERATRRML